MPKQPQAPSGNRFFARVDRFTCECPVCGLIIAAHTLPQQNRIKRRWQRGFEPGAPYNPYTSRLRCPGCSRIFGVGLLLWPVPARGLASPAVSMPPDQKPTRRQLLELRQYGQGVWVDDVAPDGEQNVAVTEPCTCEAEQGGWDKHCSVHGWDAFRAERDARRQR